MFYGYIMSGEAVASRIRLAGQTFDYQRQVWYILQLILVKNPLRRRPPDLYIHNNKPQPVFALDIQGFVSEIDHTTIIVGCVAKWSIQVILQQSLQELRQKKH